MDYGSLPPLDRLAANLGRLPDEKIFGHLWYGHSVDKIFERPDLAYMMARYNYMELTRFKGSQNRWTEFDASVARFVRERDDRKKLAYLSPLPQLGSGTSPSTNPIISQRPQGHPLKNQVVAKIRVEGGHQGPIVIAPNGMLGYIGCRIAAQYGMVVFETTTNKVSGTMLPNRDYTSSVKSISISPDGSRIYALSGLRIIRIDQNSSSHRYDSRKHVLITRRQYMGSLMLSFFLQCPSMSRCLSRSV